MTIYQTNSAHEWNANVDVASGDLLTKGDYVSDAGSYNVFAPPKESPLDGPRTVQTNPDDALASPFGWHDTDGAAGADVDEDDRQQRPRRDGEVDANNVPDVGSEPDGGPASSSTSRST